MSQFERFSKKQRKAMNWWCSGDARYSGIICDGAVRSGKTLCLSIGFAAWAMTSFDGESFALCGKSVRSLRRNLVTPLLQCLPQLGIACKDHLSRGYLTLTLGKRSNRFYLFGGKDEGSAALIQGVTLAGVLFDEVALMPRSFVEQALARCSVEGALYWFCCNPEHPGHWFYTEWIQKAAQKQMLYLHFTMEDNPSLSPAVKKRYAAIYSGSFYERFVLGKWTAAHGAVYPLFAQSTHVVQEVPDCTRFYISCDYGTVNPMSMGLWGEADGVWYRMREYYHDSRIAGIQKTDAEYYQALEQLAATHKIEAVVVDPSAASFIACIRQHGVYSVIPAKNNVADGIRAVSELLRQNKLLFHQDCSDCIREFSLYRWDDTPGKDAPIKANDHAMDDLRYFVSTVLTGQTAPGMYSVSAPRRSR